MTTKYLSKADILGADDLEIREVDVPEWGGVVRVKALNGRQRASVNEFIANYANKKLTEKMTAITGKLLAMSIIDEDGKQIFSEKDIKKLEHKNGKILNKLFEVADELSCIMPSDEVIGEIVKNFVGDQNDDSTSDSQKS